MRCSVKDLLKNDGEVAEIGGTLEYEMLENNGDEIYFTTPISFSGELKNNNGEILASGDIEFDYKVKCHRCGEEVTFSEKISVNEIFSNQSSDENYLLVGETLDLENMIIDNIRLSLPIKFLCKEDCKGVCTKCGINLNNEQCNCKEEKVDSRFEVLTTLLK
jgi:uncharacterized protein